MSGLYPQGRSVNLDSAVAQLPRVFGRLATRWSSLRRMLVLCGALTRLPVSAVTEKALVLYSTVGLGHRRLRR